MPTTMRTIGTGKAPWSYLTDTSYQFKGPDQSVGNGWGESRGSNLGYSVRLSDDGTVLAVSASGPAMRPAAIPTRTASS